VVRPPVLPTAQPIPPRTGLQLTGDVARPPVALAPEAPTTGSGAGIPRTLSGESALRTEILGGQSNENLMKIARSRGINVTQEAQLKAGVANKSLINKIVDDFSDDELDDVRQQFAENSRFGHDFGNLTEKFRTQNPTLTPAQAIDKAQEVWNVKAIQTYFPDVKISAASLARTQTAIAGGATKPAPAVAPAATNDFTPALQEMLRQTKGGKRLQDLR
jgi:hypothetical protein